MCLLSSIMQEGQQIWPQLPSLVIQQTDGNVPSVEQWTEFLALLDKARKFDELTGQADCEDPAKVEWFEEMNRRVLGLDIKTYQRRWPTFEAVQLVEETDLTAVALWCGGEVDGESVWLTDCDGDQDVAGPFEWIVKYPMGFYVLSGVGFHRDHEEVG